MVWSVKQQKTKSDVFTLKNEHNLNCLTAIKKFPTDH